MKFKRLIPLISTSSVVAVMAPMCLTSCAKYQNVNIKDGYTPKIKPKEHTEFATQGDANYYYSKAKKDVIIQDYLWSTGSYIKEKMEFPSPILPFKFVDIEQVSVSVENWWTHIDEKNKSYFQSSFELVCKVSGQTQIRNGMNNYGSYIPDSHTTISFTIHASKMPSQVIDTERMNAAEARWIVQPAPDEILQSNDDWNVNANASFQYVKRNSYDETITSTDTLAVYWYKDYIYNEYRDDPKSYIFPFLHDCLFFGSYHLQNCELKI